MLFRSPPNISGDIGDYFIDGLFSGCSSLISMNDVFNIPQGITTFGKYGCAAIFSECRELINLNNVFKIPQSLVSYYDNFATRTFENCGKLQSGAIQFFGSLCLDDIDSLIFFETFKNCASLDEAISSTTIPQLTYSPSTTNRCFGGSKSSSLTNCPAKWM